MKTITRQLSQMKLLSSQMKLLSRKSIAILSIVGFTSTLSAQQGATLNFDGIDDEVNCGTSTSFDLSGNFTIEAWIYPTAKSTISSIVSKRMGGSGQPGYQLGINSWNTSDGRIWFETSSSTNVYTSTSVTLNTWQHVAVVVTGTTAAIYLNGIAQPLVSNDVLLSASTEPLLIGGFRSGYNFAGSIDELRIWNYAQCQGEIQNNMNGEIPTTASGLIANYHFNQGNAGGSNPTDTVLNEFSGNNFSGTLMNFALTGSSSNFIALGGVISGVAVTPFAPPHQPMYNQLVIPILGLMETHTHQAIIQLLIP